jgi:uncharacterized protein
MAADPFVVPVARLRRRAGERSHEVRRGPFDPDGVLAPPRPADTRVPDGAEAEADLVLESFFGGVMATGTVRAPWTGCCRRCAVEVTGRVEVPVKERFVDPPAPGQPEDDEAYLLVEDRADLGPLVREAVLLELPLAPLCRADCAGLCPECGADRNQGPCGCGPRRDPRWASLDALRGSPGA